jgi:hypothetical protein
VCGDVSWDRQNNICEIGNDIDESNSDVFYNNMSTIITALVNKYKIVFVGSKETITYFKTLLYAAGDKYLLCRYNFNKNKVKEIFNKCVYTIDITDIYNKTFIEYNSHSKYRKNKAQQYINDIVANKIFKKLDGMKFDTIIQNPPYNKNLHLDFFEKGLDLLSDTGKMVIIEPATWLINVRKNIRTKRYDIIKERINSHVESVVIENLNSNFNTSMFVPFVTTTIDMSKKFDTIDFTCCGETKKVKSIYDCNLIGNYNLICSIFNKVLSFGDMMDSHITKENKGDNFYYTKYAEICDGQIIRGSRKPTFYKKNGLEWAKAYFSIAYHLKCNSISSTPVLKTNSNEITYNIYGTKEELENWKHFIFNNKLPLFLNIVLTIDQNNNSKEYLPWLVDKQYTDDEINKLFNFTEEEIKLIDATIKKFERNSPWFKRYMCGKDSVSNEEVNAFIEKINN